jgi:Uma2 family endonuclease
MRKWRDGAGIIRDIVWRNDRHRIPDYLESNARHRRSPYASFWCMSIARHEPHMTREEFLNWAAAQEQRYEFDGFQAVAMTGGTRGHSRISQHVYYALRSRLRGTGCDVLGPDAGVATTGEAVRYPDALVTCTKGPGTDRVVPGVVVVFEVLSPTSGRTDRIEKLREYQSVSSIRRYVILEHTSVGLAVYSRLKGEDPWIATALTGGDVLRMPEVRIEIPIAEFYEGTDNSDQGNEVIGEAPGASR